MTTQVIVSSEAVADYLPRCESIARPMVNMGNSGAEFDDLVQEGLIFVWKSLQAGVKPRTELIQKRMLNWVRYCRRHDAVSYEEAMEEDADVLALG